MNIWELYRRIREKLLLYQTTVTPPPPAAAIIEYNYQTTLTPAQQAAFDQAQAKWNAIITEELEPVTIDGVSTTKIIVDVVVQPIDGSGNVLGQAGPTSLRPVSLLPATGVMEFDDADLGDLETLGLLDEVIFHELGHVIGIGTLWSMQGLLTGGGTTNPEFTGNASRAEYGVLTGSGPADVPVENAFGAGSNDAHWRESLFDDELMTSQLDLGVNPISRLTIASVEDLGYTVDYAQAEAYSLPPGGSLIGPTTTREICCGGAIMDADKLPILD